SGGAGQGDGGVLTPEAAVDFTLLDLSRPRYDLSDRGVAGRPYPGPVDVFLYSERGVFRPGETIPLVALARDPHGVAVVGMPLTVELVRPDEVVAERLVLEPGGAGSYHTRLALASTARSGAWTVRAYTDPQASPAGSLTLQVEDFVPQRLEVTFEDPPAALTPAGSGAVDVRGRFFYGAPAAALEAQGELVLRLATDPHPAYPAYQFGLVQDEFNPVRVDVAVPPTDARGGTTARFALRDLPDTTRPLEAVLTVTLFEPGGRPVSRRATLAVPRAEVIGVKPRFEQPLAEGQNLAFDVVMLDAAGQPRGVRGLGLRLYRESHRYLWYYQNNRWDYQLIIEDAEVLANRQVDLAADEPLRVEQGGLPAGRYRLEVFDPNSGAATSYRFRVGWYTAPEVGDTPDQLELTLDRDHYRPGDNARLHIRTPFAGQVLLTAAADRLLTTQTLAVAPGGTTLEVEVAEDWGPGVYLTATAFRPGRGDGRRPGRAVGVTWLGLDPAAATLDIELDVPKLWRPRREVTVAVTVADAREETFLTLAAVDEGVLQLTDYQTPDPRAHFWGQRRLGVEILDLYGRLIEPTRDDQRRVGGDGLGRNASGRVRTTETVALFQGPVGLDPAGRAEIPLRLPDFNGELRLMAVAFDSHRTGSAGAAVPVRDPLVTEVYLPRFLAPDDVAQVTLRLDDVDAPPGDYRVDLTARDSLQFAAPAQPNLTLPDADGGLGAVRHYL
ncbi:MAG: alpha-2-macroglobulin, partial [Candidatus Competibacterales bacterium]